MFGVSFGVKSTLILSETRDGINAAARYFSVDTTMRYQLPDNWNFKRLDFFFFLDLFILTMLGNKSETFYVA